ncbi:MAG: peptide-methionine (R)-S-oxide reductase MsrB [Paracoccaceae bacterium]|jgi:peptide-methionine (R)-S-oxide reductase|nr:peptide-methionine (R)-S-oxide reductase MsrB [Paracoccaceae bacterium]|tara:strand:- start:168 stop:557 length:390 start_codon:yes stop_codon:yes gene_type:complete
MDKIKKSDEEWKAELSELEFRVTRKGATEMAFSNDSFPKSPAFFKCVCCKEILFDSEHKFDSGSGWPSFFKPADESMISEKEDNSWIMRRTEVVCAKCDAHLGHLFPDGPNPTGLRYCINGAALERDEK